MKRRIRRSRFRSLMFTLTAVFCLALFSPCRLAADQKSYVAGLNSTEHSDDTDAAYATAAHNIPVSAYETGPGNLDSGIPDTHAALQHPLINLPPVYQVKRTLSPVTGHKTTDHRIDGLVHLVGSHISGIVRPVSLITRLLSLVAYTGLDALRVAPRHDTPMELPSLPRHGKGMDLAAWEEELDVITGSEASMGLMEPLIDGDEFFPSLERTVANAAESVHLQTYIFDNDDYAINFGRFLKERSSEVDVKVLMDGLGSILAGGVDHESLPADYIPPSSLQRYLKEGSRVKVRKLTNPWLTFDHTKSIVIDRRVAFVGGMNIGREYRHIWHDMMVQVEGPVVGILQQEFTRTWHYAGVSGDLALLTSYAEKACPSLHRSTYPVRVLKTRIGHSQIYRAHIAAIKRAESYIYIENPYLSDDVILHELIMARRRGVDVRVILPLKCNWKAMKRSNVLAANMMVANGIRVYMYPGMSHVKAAVVDGWACLGSANMDKASFRFNREINLATSHPAFVDTLKSRLFEKDFEKSVLLTESQPEKRADRLYEMIADLM